MNSIIDPFERFDLNIMEAGYDSVDSSWHRFVTFFPYYRIYYIVSGHALIYLQDEVLELFPGKMYFIPAFSVFDAHCDEILTHYWIHFNLDTITEKYLTICRPKNQAETLSTDENIFRMVVDSVKKPGKEKSIRDAVASEGLSKYLFSRFLPERENIAASRVSVLFRCQYIEKFRPSHHELELGQILYLSPTYFSNLLQNNSGFLLKYILQKRLNSGDSAL
ncbi:MAG: AraC family ligand binding domain-containing protein [Christensenellaceae bacterium]